MAQQSHIITSHNISRWLDKIMVPCLGLAKPVIRMGYNTITYMWLLLATMASMFWGMSYVFSEQIYKYISVPTAFALEMFIISLGMAALAIYKNVFEVDLATIGSSSRLSWLLVASILTFAGGELGIGYAINGKNATLAGLIEISYPLFIVLFAYLFFQESELNLGTALGGLLVFGGVCVIYYFSR